MISADNILRQLEEIRRNLGPPPPRIQVSKYATALPQGKPRTDDMKEMVDRLGVKRVPAKLRFTNFDAFGRSHEVVVLHPDLVRRY